MTENFICPICNNEMNDFVDYNICSFCNTLIQTSYMKCEHCDEQMYELTFDVEDGTITRYFCKNCKKITNL